MDRTEFEKMKKVEIKQTEMDIRELKIELSLVVHKVETYRGSKEEETYLALCNEVTELEEDIEACEYALANILEFSYADYETGFSPQEIA